MSRSGHQRHISYRLLLMILWLALLVFAIELTAGWVSQSLCLLAESLHTLIDVFSTLISLIAVASPQRTLGREIWGHGRSEAAGALILSAMLGFAGISILLIAGEQMTTLFQPAVLLRGAITLPLVVLVSVTVALLFGAVLFAAHQSEQNSSLALKLNVSHILSDSWLSVLLASRFGVY